MNLFIEALAWLFDPAHLGAIGRRVTEHLLFTLAVVAASAIIALPLGILIGHTKRGAVAMPLLTSAARALPTLGLLTLVGLWLGIGVQGPFLALLVLALPPMLAGAYAGVGGADPVTVDAARALGLSERQVLTQVELPAAAPLIVEGIRSTTLQVVATATLAAYNADVGLGRFLFAGLKTRDYAQMLGGAVLVVVLALVLDLLLVLLKRAAIRLADPSRATRMKGETR